MATLYKKPNSKFWYAQFTTADGARISRSTGTTKRKEAKQIASGLEADERKKRQGRPGLPAAIAQIVETAGREASSGELTLARAEELILRLHRIANPSFRIVSLADHLNEWVTAQSAHVKPKTMQVYYDMVRRVLAGLGPKISSSAVGDLKKTDIESALKKIKKTKVGNTDRCITSSTVNMDLRALRRALKSAVEEGLAKTNVADGIRPLPQDDSTERAPFDTTEVRKMIDYPGTSDEWKGLILIGAHTGLRMSDIVKLSSENIEATRLVVRPGKTNRTRKTLSIPMSPPVIAWCKDRRGPLFPTLSNLQIGTLSTIFRRIMEKSGVPREVTEAGEIVKRRSFHCLRHSFTSWLAEADIHADVRRKLTGHQSAGIHEIYTHHDESLERAIRKLPML